MGSFQTTGNTGTWIPSSVEDVSPVVVLGLVEQGLDSWLDETPGTGIERFLLAPDNILSIGVAVEVLLQLLPWEWVQLFNSGDSGVGDVVGGTVFLEGSVDLARAENHTFDLLGLVNGVSVLGIGDDPLEVRFAREVLNRRSSKWVTEERFGEEDNEGYRE